MLGDGCLQRSQLFITVNIKTDYSPYVSYLQDLLERLFDFRPSVTAVRRGSTVDLYVTSTYLMKELRSIGLYSANKVRDQVGIPRLDLSKSGVSTALCARIL